MIKLHKIKRSGYWYLLKKDHPFAGKQGYIAEHRLIMEKKLGRHLTSQETVHHINGIKIDNRIENLELFATHGLHTKQGHPQISEFQKVLFQGKHFSPKTEWQKGDKRLIGNQFKKGKSSWNKGKKWSEEHKQKLRNSHIGKHKPTRTSFQKGMIPWNKGIKKSHTNT